MSLKIKSNTGEYEVDYLSDPREVLSQFDDSCFFIIDKKVLELYHDVFTRSLPTTRMLAVEANEINKELGSLEPYYLDLIGKGIRKNSRLVVIGGGVLQDIGGFVASTLYRGIAWTLVPTTLLAQADSCIGAKTSVNLPHLKNQIGTFSSPNSVLIAHSFIKTLTTMDFLSGIGEIAKLAIIAGDDSFLEFEAMIPALFEREEKATLLWIQKSLELKKRYIEADEFDRGIRNFLNFGHCFGHALESATDYRLPHGQAVSIGIILADYLAFERGLVSGERRRSHEYTLRKIVSVGLENLGASNEAIIQGMANDKKRTTDMLTVIVSKEDATMMRLDDVSELEIVSAIKAILGKSR